MCVCVGHSSMNSIENSVSNTLRMLDGFRLMVLCIDTYRKIGSQRSRSPSRLVALSNRDFRLVRILFRIQFLISKKMSNRFE